VSLPQDHLSRRLLGPDGRVVIVAIDHPMYSWPCPGLEDRGALVGTCIAAGADAFIAAYGTLRDLAPELAGARRILKLDLTTLALRAYPVAEYRLAWTLDDAVRLTVDAVLTYVQIGGPEELTALTSAARVAAAADRAGLPYVCEIMPVESERFPDATDPVAIAAATRTAIEIGSHVVKTTIPTPPEAIAQASGFGVPVVVAGGDPAPPEEKLAQVHAAVSAGAAGVAVGRNVWGAPRPGDVVASLVEAVHGSRR
jgi:class I fructose-bisphosphate aldolase/fructose-bisphosphate aldolase/2-amino-3,7-dideoxy-D-threo-hept-6-ulosonate synthase